MFSHQPPSLPPDSAARSRLFARIDTKTSERYWLIFWIQLGLTIAAYFYINSNSAYILFAVVCILWIQFVLIELAIVPLIVMHELGHASVAALLDVKVSKITIGVGKTIGRLQLFNIPCIIAQFPIGGMLELYQKSFEFYRLKHFSIIFAGPLTHIILSLLLWKTQLSFKWYLTRDASIDLISCLTIANLSLLFGNLWPYKQNVNENWIETEFQSDGLQMLKAPFLSDREIANSIASIHLIEGWEYLEEKQYHQAIKSFHAALAIASQLVRAYQGMALIYQYLLDYTEAIDNFSHIIELNISNVLAYLYRGICYFEWGKSIDCEDEDYLIEYQNAIDDFSTAVTINRTLIAAYYLRAAINFYLENLDLSIADFSRIIELEPSANAHYNRAIIWWEKGEDRSAITDLDRAIELSPNFVAAYYWRGNIYYQLGDETRGLQDYNTAQSIDCNDEIFCEQQFAVDEHGFYARGIARARLGERVGATVDFHAAENLCATYKNTITARRIRSAIAQWNLV